MSYHFDFHDQSALLDRLTNGLHRRNQEVVFLVGAPLSAPKQNDAPGVPGVDGVIELIKAEFNSDPEQAESLDRSIAADHEKRYQNAFLFLQGRRGQQSANEIIRRAVCSAIVAPSLPPIDEITDEKCRLLEADAGIWALSPGMESLGKIIVHYPDIFGRSTLTTNFDPLIEISVRRNGGSYFRTTLHRDGNLAQTEGIGCHIVHLHGYWFGSDTLHTVRQLSQSRPRLKASLRSFLMNKVVVTCAYSGWDDTFTEAMTEIVLDDSAFPEILWTFFSPSPTLSPLLEERLGPGIDRARVNLYSGIDCNTFFPELYRKWQAIAPSKIEDIQPIRSLQVSARIKESIQAAIQLAPQSDGVIEGDDEDRPPVVEICVGRDNEQSAITKSDATVIFITGLGGQGKSTIAAKYFNDSQENISKFEIFIWRDCKEEGARFENQLISIMERLSGGIVRVSDTAPRAIINAFLPFIEDYRILLVFDNVDHYVDLENARMTGAAGLFVEALCKTVSKSQVLFTCRPHVTYESPRTLTCRLEGLTLNSAREVFQQRGALVTRADEIDEAHELTNGHAFWLDLMAVQVARRSPDVSLTTLIEQIRAGKGPLPAATLQSIWATLHPREQTVLRAMAETVKPETADQIAEYLRHVLNYQRTMRAVRALRALNLIVAKRPERGNDFLELHPLVRQFIRNNFTRPERLDFIEAILSVYRTLLGRWKPQLSARPSLTTLQLWTQNAELDIAAGRMEEAFETLRDVQDAFLSSSYMREFSRVMRGALENFDWVNRHSEIKFFDSLFRTHTRILSYGGDFLEADSLLDLFEKTVPDKDIRYINYCEMRSYTFWVRKNFASAIEWGRRGVDLKRSTDVDTRDEINHTLALAERDGGRPEDALPQFLAGRRIDDVIDQDELDEKRTGAYYGNVGRCLHLMGQIDQALICYQKSALLIEKKDTGHRVYNQGFVRKWIGEVLLSKNNVVLGAAFLRAAYLKWKGTAPPLAEEAFEMYLEIERSCEALTHLSDDKVEEMSLDWIFSRR